MAHDLAREPVAAIQVGCLAHPPHLAGYLISAGGGFHGNIHGGNPTTVAYVSIQIAENLQSAANKSGLPVFCGSKGLIP
jgi:hypothetical protein